MIAEMIVWGFFSAIGWMGATWTVDKIFPETPPSVTASPLVKKENEK